MRKIHLIWPVIWVFLVIYPSVKPAVKDGAPKKSVKRIEITIH